MIYKLTRPTIRIDKNKIPEDVTILITNLWDELMRQKNTNDSMKSELDSLKSNIKSLEERVRILELP